MIASYNWSRVNKLPPHILRVWMKRRWPESQATLAVDRSGTFLEISGEGIEVGRVEAMLEEVSELGWPKPA